MVSQVTQMVFRDPEVLREGIRGANLEVSKISRSQAPSRILRLALPDTSLDLLSLGPSLWATGGMPKDFYTLIFVTNCPSKGYTLNLGTEHLDGYLGILPPGIALDAITPEGYAHAALAIPEDLFKEELSWQFPEIAEHLLTRGGTMRVDLHAAGLLQSLVNRIDGMIQTEPEEATDPWILEEMQTDLLSGFIGALQDGCAKAHVRQDVRQKQLRKVREYVADHLHEPVRMEDLCRAVGLSKRSLQYLLRKYLGVTPVAYLRKQRLNACHGALLESGPRPGVIKEIALSAGFWHFGHFTAAYKRLFGEMPSETLARGVTQGFVSGETDEPARGG